MPTPNEKAFARAIALARTAFNASATEAERATATDMLATHCAKHNLNIADIIARATQADPTASEARRNARSNSKPASDGPTADAPKQPEQPTADAPKAAKPSKPSEADAKRAGEYDARVKLVNELRATTATIYNGPSLAVRSNPKRVPASVYADLFANPKHRTTLAKLSERDCSFLFTVIKRGLPGGEFDPVALNLDAGIFSRLSSIGFIAAGAFGTYRLTADALAQARRTAKAAKAA